MTQAIEPDTAKRRGDFERALSQESFIGLKAILDTLSRDREKICDALNAANSYEDLAARLGYAVVLTKQIHVQDAYTRLSPAGDIKSVLPYYDIPTQSSFPTLVTINSTVMTTEVAMRFFDKLLTTLKTQARKENQTLS